jgi:hypothetical protein
MGWLTGSDESAGANGTFDGQQATFEQNSDGLTDVYFGGQGGPLGPGHGHAVIDGDGSLEYYRDSAADGGQTYLDSRNS